MNNRRNTIAILAMLIPLMMVSAPVEAEVWSIHGIDVYRWHIRNVDGAGWDYDTENRTLAVQLVLRSREDTISSYGLALVVTLFNISAVPNKVSAYLYIGNETHDIIDQLKNYTIVEDQTFTKNNGTHQWEVSATYLEAFVYMFANHSIENEQPMPRPDFGPWNNSYPTAALASELASDTSNVVFAVSYLDGIIPPIDPLVVFGVGMTVTITVLVILAIRKHRQDQHA